MLRPLRHVDGMSLDQLKAMRKHLLLLYANADTPYRQNTLARVVEQVAYAMDQMQDEVKYRVTHSDI